MFIQCLFACFDKFSYTNAMAFSINSHVFCILPKISMAFCLLVPSRVLLLKRSTMSKLMRGYKLLKTKNRDSFVKADLLLWAANFAITIFFDQFSYW